MPIDYSEYHPKWSLISFLIRKRRANDKCEWCGVSNGKFIKREGSTFRYACQTDLDMIYSRIKCSQSNLTESLKYHGFTKVVLTVSHIDHDKTNNRFENLAALCQKCHLGHDMKEHVNNRKYGRNHKKINSN